MCFTSPCFIFLHRAEVGARNPVPCQSDEVVVDGLDNDRHWMWQCEAELKGEVQLLLMQQVNALVSRCSDWGIISPQWMQLASKLVSTNTSLKALLNFPVVKLD